MRNLPMVEQRTVLVLICCRAIAITSVFFNERVGGSWRSGETTSGSWQQPMYDDPHDVASWISGCDPDLDIRCSTSPVVREVTRKYSRATAK